MSRSSLSVVVPVYNEQDSIAGCLRSLLAQDDPVDEIVVVDNNSTDSTVSVVEEIASESPVVRIVTAAEQGVMNARSLGFDVASSELLGRVDADTRVETTWAAAVRGFFRDHGGSYAAGTGMCTAHDLPFQGWFARRQQDLSERLRRALRNGDDAAAETARLFGSNMALTRESWSVVRTRQTPRTDVFEDLDLTLFLRDSGFRVGIIPGASARISGRRFLTPLRPYLRYCWRDQRTLLGHGRRGAASLAVLRTALIQVPFYLAMWIPFRAFDPDTGRMSISRLRRRSTGRVLPSGD